MNQITARLLVVLLAHHQYGVDLDHVTRVVHAVQPTHLPGAPDVILGAFNHHGNIIPILNLRRRFGLPDKPLNLTDRFVLTTSQGHALALLVDDVKGLIERPVSDLAAMDKSVISLQGVMGALQADDGLILIYDLNNSLSEEEKQQVDAAIARHPFA
jgi:purine-binding chemotaxis protein CheW